MLKSLLIGGPLNGQWIEQGREQEKLHLEHDGQTYEYSRTLYLWQAQNAMWLFYWHGKPSSAEVLSTIEAAGPAPVCNISDAFSFGGLDVSPHE